MKRAHHELWAAVLAVSFLSGCNVEKQEQEDDYLQVIGEAEMPMDGAGYRLNLSYNGPMHIRQKFTVWADSLAKELPSMTLINESVYMNYMPEQVGQQKIRPDMFQTSVSYNVTVPDSATYGRIVRDALAHQFPFNLNASGTHVEEEKRGQLQQELMAQALENAEEKLNNLSGGKYKYKIVGIEELDSNQPYGPEYYDFNRKMVSRVKVKARLLPNKD